MNPFADPEKRLAVIESALDVAKHYYRKGNIDQTAVYIDFVRGLGATQVMIDRVFDDSSP